MSQRPKPLRVAAENGAVQGAGCGGVVTPESSMGAGGPADPWVPSPRGGQRSVAQVSPTR